MQLRRTQDKESMASMKGIIEIKCWQSKINKSPHENGSNGKKQTNKKTENEKRRMTKKK